MTVTFDQFVKDYNKYYQCNFRTIHVNTHDIFEVMWNLYDTDDFEIDEDNETIELF